MLHAEAEPLRSGGQAWLLEAERRGDRAERVARGQVKSWPSQLLGAKGSRGRASCSGPSEVVAEPVARGQVKSGPRRACGRVLELRRGERRRERKGHGGPHVGSHQCRGTSVRHEAEEERMRMKARMKKMVIKMSAYFRKRGSASYIVREVQSVRERVRRK